MGRDIELTGEDSLRLNVMLANADAIRIDENSLEVIALQGDREVRLELHPNTQDGRYVRRVRSLISSVVLDLPGGYPLSLRRWSRMGQMEGLQIERLLKLGEPEAVMAVVSSPSLTHDVAQLAWWCAPGIDSAVQLLQHGCVTGGVLGPIVADYLYEHLPFISEPYEMMVTVQLLLQSGLLSGERRDRVWAQGATRSPYRVAFLASCTGPLPGDVMARGDLYLVEETLRGGSLDRANPYAALLCGALEQTGQQFADHLGEIIAELTDQDVAGALFKALERFYSCSPHNALQLREVEAIEQRLRELLDADGELQSLLAALPGLGAEIRAVVRLAHCGDALLIPVLSLTDASGSVMRKKIAHLTDYIEQQVGVLRATPCSESTGISIWR